jgi:hypothetical protein
MSLVSVAEVRDALGIGALYDDEVIQQAIDAAEDVILAQLVVSVDGVAVDYSTKPAVLEALLMTACDIWQARSATNGQPVGIDFQPSPFRMGRSLTSRISGLIAPYVNLGGLLN